MDNRDHKRHNVFESGRERTSVSDTAPQTLATQEEFLGWVNTRAGKLVTALYMVTDYMPEREPMKESLRSLGVLLVSDTRTLFVLSGSDRHMQLTNLQHSISEILSLLDIAATVGMISSMNYEILERQFVHVLKTIESNRETDELTSGNDTHHAHAPARGVRIDERFFSDGAPRKTPETSTSKGQSFTKRQVKDTPDSQGQTAKPIKNKQYSRALEVGLRMERRNRILRILKEEGSVSIKDIREVVTDCSEKTLQRTLNKLIKEGLVKKTGKRRWSRYSLA